MWFLASWRGIVGIRIRDNLVWADFRIRLHVSYRIILFNHFLRQHKKEFGSTRKQNLLFPTVICKVSLATPLSSLMDIEHQASPILYLI